MSDDDVVDEGAQPEPDSSPGRLGLKPTPFAGVVVAAIDLCQRRSREFWKVSLGCHVPLAVIGVVALAVSREDQYRTIGLVLAYLLVSGAATFLAQVQLARYAAKDWLGQPLEGDCAPWWRRHMPGVVQSAGATFVGLCGVYGAIYYVFVILLLLIGPDNEPAMALLSMLMSYAIWFSDLAFRAMAVFVPTVTGFGLAAGWDALGRSFRTARAALERKSEIVPMSLGAEMVMLRASFVLSNLFEGHEPLAFVLVHTALLIAVRPVLTAIQACYLIDALGREQGHDETALTASLRGAAGSE